MRVDYDKDQLSYALRERDEAREESLEQAKLLGMSGERECRLIAERDEIQEKYDTLAVENMLEVNKLCKERDEAREQIKELIYISERAIALAEIDFENDKFGAVSELRDGVERIKEGAK
jgi:hypothetical protein